MEKEQAMPSNAVASSDASFGLAMAALTIRHCPVAIGEVEELLQVQSSILALVYLVGRELAVDEALSRSCCFVEGVVLAST